MNPFLESKESATDSGKLDNTPNILDLFGVQAPPANLVIMKQPFCSLEFRLDIGASTVIDIKIVSKLC